MPSRAEEVVRAESESGELFDDVASVNAQTALTRFYHDSINASSWTIFDENSNVRIAYIGAPVSNLAALVGEERTTAGYLSKALHYPFPSTKAPLPWKPPKTMPLLKWYSSGLADDISALPSKELRDDMIDAFFRDVHPGFPVLEAAQFMAQYRDATNPPPLLLYQAVLLVGAHVSKHPVVSKSRSLIKMALFRRAKALFDLHYENNRMHLVQAALLFTWHFESSDDVSSNAYYWVGIACRIAFGLGMHRDLSSSAVSNMPLNDPLHHGRPLSIHLDDCDQPPLTMDDFCEKDQPPADEAGVHYCIQSVALCIIIASLMSSTSPAAFRRYKAEPPSFASTLASLGSKLAAWYLDVSPAISTTSPQPQFWSLQLQLHYNMALLYLHRLPGSAGVQIDAAQERASSEASQNAASAIVTTFKDIMENGAAKQCWFTASPTLLAAAIQTSREARVAVKSNMLVLATQAQAQLERLLPLIRSVSEYWGGADAVLHLYKGLSDELKQQLRSALLPQAQLQPIESAPENLSFCRSFDACDAVSAGPEYTPTYSSHLGDQWRSLFGAGEPGEFIDANLADIEGWFTPPSSRSFPNGSMLEPRSLRTHE
ncbi:Acetamidase regulatory protein [Cyphellophora attinorum]|uniref:Acetamidase regulatory protein n=1 Tax=Cyphellophora attinorum TaxID=1664694 RepID=A0A0N0NPG2_9EURO|nr:Acetamidase regulatory protein [Phialophora attinorum]KPI42688.1 Acetamidase regulatory protein [Phialophora attinorum]